MVLVSVERSQLLAARVCVQCLPGQPDFMQRHTSLGLFLMAAFCCWPLPAQAETTASGGPVERALGTWHGRFGVGVNPVSSGDNRLPTAHTGFGASLSGFVLLPLRLSAGLNFDWDRYTFDSANHEDLGTSVPPRYRDEVLMHTRLMALVQWDVLSRGLITPFVVAGAGYGWEHAALTEWQCTPKLSSGLVYGAGLGLDLAVYEAVAIGIEYRANALPDSTKTCTLAIIDNEPLGTPSDFFSQRIGLTLSVRSAAPWSK